MTTDTFIAETAALAPCLSDIRRDFHLHAESGWTEMRTASLIARKLKDLGYEVLTGRAVCDADARMGVPDDTVLNAAYERAKAEGADPEFLEETKGGFTGVIGIIRGEQPGPVIGMRFDIDALGVAECTADSHVPAAAGFVSRHDGVMHACGHDGHAAIGLGTAEILMRHKDEVCGTVKLIFQPAEEGVRGAKSIVAAGHLDDVDILLGSHITGLPADESYDITAGAGGSLATTKLDAYFTGRAAHAGGAPQNGDNAMLTMASAILNLHAIPRHGGGATRINVGRADAGTGRNVIPDRAKLELEIRGETTKLNKYMEDYARRILTAAADMHGCAVEIRLMGAADSLESSPELMEEVQELAPLCGLVPADHLRGHSGGSEDFAYMMNRVQERGGLATFMRLMTPVAGPAHSPAFDFDERVLVNGVRAFAGYVLMRKN
ncbi:MAG: amidohydrolase [Ruminococcaceae bacterium]|nr:amidohydrolase [Oscillospiraceae bacterium]